MPLHPLVGPPVPQVDEQALPKSRVQEQAHEGGSILSPAELQEYLYRHIPLSRAMGVGVVEVGEEAVVLKAPLEPNINHRETVFGGSASAVAILAAWSLLHGRLTSAGIETRLVIQRNTMEYRQPILGEFTARASLCAPEQWPAFLALLERKGKARIRVASVVEYGGQVAGEFTGDFVALGFKAGSGA